MKVIDCKFRTLRSRTLYALGSIALILAVSSISYYLGVLNSPVNNKTLDVLAQLDQRVIDLESRIVAGSDGITKKVSEETTYEPKDQELMDRSEEHSHFNDVVEELDITGDQLGLKTNKAEIMRKELMSAIPITNTGGHISEIGERFDADIYYNDDSYDVQGLIENAFVSESLSGLNLGGVDCRSTLCRIEYERSEDVDLAVTDELELSIAISDRLNRDIDLVHGSDNYGYRVVYLEL